MPTFGGFLFSFLINPFHGLASTTNSKVTETRLLPDIQTTLGLLIERICCRVIG